MKEEISRSKISSHYKSFFGLENMGLAENDNLMIDWGESLINELVNQEVEKRIKELMSDEEIRIIAINYAPPLMYSMGDTDEDVNYSIRNDVIGILTALRSRLTPQDTHQEQRTEGGGESIDTEWHGEQSPMG